VAEHAGLRVGDRADLAAGFQKAVTDVLIEKSRRALELYLAITPDTPAFAVAGGVAANETIRSGLEAAAKARGVQFVAPPIRLCTDNAAMIAWSGLELFQNGHRDGLDLVARPRWPLDQSKPALVGSGKKGAKA
jgi:N6-L-threonylcarbamoyladenine synthase